eukprot:scaffold49703_cov76-Phaeocystis_antarctica.AAC.1
MFIYFAMLSDDKDTFTSSTFGSGVGNKRHPRHLFRLRSRSLKIKDTTERAAAPSPDLFRLRVGVGNKRHPRQTSLSARLPEFIGTAS